MPRRFEPRSLLVAPRFFGQRIDAKWKAWDEGEEPVIGAAYLQHRMSLVAGKIVTEETTLESAAGCLGVPAAQLRRKLRGEVPLTMDDLLKWLLLFGVDVIPALDESDNVLPHEFVKS